MASLDSFLGVVREGFGHLDLGINHEACYCCSGNFRRLCRHAAGYRHVGTVVLDLVLDLNLQLFTAGAEFGKASPFRRLGAKRDFRVQQ